MPPSEQRVRRDWTMEGRDGQGPFRPFPPWSPPGLPVRTLLSAGPAQDTLR